MEATEDSTDATPPDLTCLYGFSSEDLVHNREGQLSPNQRDELRRAMRYHVFGTGVVLAFAIFSSAVSHGNPGAWLVPGIFLIVGVVQLSQRVTELHEGILYEVIGDARPEFVPDSEGPDDYWLHIGGLKLDITEAAYAAFRPGGPYRIYYVAATHTAVGGETLPGWRPLPTLEPARRHWWQNLGVGVEVG